MKNANSIRSDYAKWQRADGIGTLCGLAVAMPNRSYVLVHTCSDLASLCLVNRTLAHLNTCVWLT